MARIPKDYQAILIALKLSSLYIYSSLFRNLVHSNFTVSKNIIRLTEAKHCLLSLLICFLYTL